MSKRIDLTGKRFGNWQVIGYAGIRGGQAAWVCRCDCNTIRTVRGSTLRNGESKSCGCLNGIPYSWHQASKTRLYSIWSDMKRRCSNKNNSQYKYYGGRGISVCDEWANSFPVFQEWALSHGYQDNLSIDRIDVNGDYCSSNCRWTTTKEQCNNRRSNIFCEIDGVRKTLAQWADDTGMPRKQIYSRYHDGKRGHDLIRPVAS